MTPRPRRGTPPRAPTPRGRGPEYHPGHRPDPPRLPAFDVRDDATGIGLGLRPDLTGQGLGEELIAAGLRFAAERFGSRAFTLTVAAFNERAHPRTIAESSMILALRPELVRAGLAAVGYTGDPKAVLDTIFASGFAAVTANGVLGDPAGMSARLGRALLDGMAGRIAAHIEAAW